MLTFSILLPLWQETTRLHIEDLVIIFLRFTMDISNFKIVSNPFDKLPNEIICQILKYLSSEQDQSNCFNVSQKWRRLISRIPSLQKQFNCKYSIPNLNNPYWSIAHSVVFPCHPPLLLFRGRGGKYVGVVVGLPFHYP